MVEEIKQLKFTQKPNPSWAFEVEKLNPWVYWNNAFTPEECNKIISYAEQFQKQSAGISNKNELNNEIRQSEIVWITPEPEINWVYQRLTDLVTKLNDDYFKFDLFGFVEGLQFTKYNAPSGYYGKHIDNIFYGTVRKLSIVIQLSDPKDYEGGDLLIHLGDIPNTPKKEQGTLICFPSYMLHEVTKITKGTRYSLVGWITGKPFK